MSRQAWKFNFSADPRINYSMTRQASDEGRVIDLLRGSSDLQVFLYLINTKNSRFVNLLANILQKYKY